MLGGVQSLMTIHSILLLFLKFPVPIFFETFHFVVDGSHWVLVTVDK